MSKKNQFTNKRHQRKQIETVKKYMKGDFGTSGKEDKGKLANEKSQKEFLQETLQNNDLMETYVNDPDL